MNIIKLIPYGSRNAVSREYLMQETHMSDRRVRRMIEEARDSGEVIIALSSLGGYFRPVYPDDAHYVDHLVAENISRSSKNLDNNKPLIAWLKKHRGENKVEEMQMKMAL